MSGLLEGKRLYDKMRDAWLEAALFCRTETDSEELAEFRTAFGRKPKDLILALERFPEAFNADADPDLYDILAAVHLSKVKDDEEASALWDRYKDNLGYDELREEVKELIRNGRAPRAENVTLAERIAEAHEKCRNSGSANALTMFMNFVVEQPEVATALEKRRAK